MDDASFEASLEAAGGGTTLAVSVLAVLVVELPVGGVDGADATDGSAAGAGVEVEGVELEAGAALNGVGGAAATLGRLELVLAAFLDGAAVTLAGSAGALVALALLRLAFGGVATATSATLDGLSRVSVVVVAATSAGAEMLAALPEPTLLAFCTAVGGAWISMSLYLLLKNSAPPITDAVMAPNAIPKWFTGTS